MVYFVSFFGRIVLGRFGFYFFMFLSFRVSELFISSFECEFVLFLDVARVFGFFFFEGFVGFF